MAPDAAVRDQSSPLSKLAETVARKALNASKTEIVSCERAVQLIGVIPAAM